MRTIILAAGNSSSVGYARAQSRQRLKLFSHPRLIITMNHKQSLTTNKRINTPNEFVVVITDLSSASFGCQRSLPDDVNNPVGHIWYLFRCCLIGIGMFSELVGVSFHQDHAPLLIFSAKSSRLAFTLPSFGTKRDRFNFTFKHCKLNLEEIQRRKCSCSIIGWEEGRRRRKSSSSSSNMPDSTGEKWGRPVRIPRTNLRACAKAQRECPLSVSSAF